MMELLWESITDVWHALKHASLSEENMTYYVEFPYWFPSGFQKNRTEVKVVYVILQAENKLQVNHNMQILIKTSKFEWTLDNIRIEKIISAPIWEVSALLDARHCLKLQSCAISRKTNATLRKWPKPQLRAQFHPHPPLPPIFLRKLYLC